MKEIILYGLILLGIITICWFLYTVHLQNQITVDDLPNCPKNCHFERCYSGFPDILNPDNCNQDLDCYFCKDATIQRESINQTNQTEHINDTISRLNNEINDMNHMIDNREKGIF